MRGAYLRPRSVDRTGGSRGGVGGFWDDRASGPDYELEIGQGQNASPEMLALCAHYDEIMELLDVSKSPLAAMVKKSITNEAGRLKADLAQHRNVPA